MKSLNIQVEDSFYEALLERLKNLPKNKIQIQETDSDNRLDFEQEMDYTLKKNQELYKKVCHDTAVNTGVNPVIA